jgi:hypothetical protein
MGIFMKNQQAVLTPQNPPIGIFPQYCVAGPTTLVLKEKVWSWSGVSHLGHIPDIGRSGRVYQRRYAAFQASGVARVAKPGAN